MTNDREQGKAREDLKMAMEAYARENLAVAFSGGVDSSLLLHLACAYAKNPSSVHAVILKTMLQTEEEVQKAREAAIEMGATAWVLSVDDWEEAGILDNPPERCYLCKKVLFCRMMEMAAAEGYEQMLDGSNINDISDYRPGVRALRELGVISPLQEVGLTKEEIRILSRAHGLNTWQKPSFACLASRFVYGEEITREKLDMVDQAEQKLMDLGFHQFRVRIHGKLARIEVLKEEMGRLLESDILQEVTEYLKKLGFSYVTMDLMGYRRGSMNDGLGL